MKKITSNWNFDITQMPEVGDKVIFEGDWFRRYSGRYSGTYTVTSIKKHTRGDYDVYYVDTKPESLHSIDIEVYYTNKPEMGTPEYNSEHPWRKKKDKKSFTVEFDFSWKTASEYMMIVIESHAKKSFTKSEARDEVKKQLFHMSQVADEYVAKMKEGAE